MHRLGERNSERVAVLRALQLGDLLCAVPALRALRAALPRSEVFLISLPWAEQLLERYPRYLDGFIPFPGYPGLPECPPRVREIPGFPRAVQEMRLDLVIQMHGCGFLMNSVAALLGARQTAGFYPPGGHCPDASLFIDYPERLPEVKRPLRLLEALGAPPAGDHLEWPILERDQEALAAIEEAQLLTPGRSRIVITNDTGISHMAAGLRVPSVVIYSASDPDRWAPLELLKDPARARRLGESARKYAEERFNIGRFLLDWDQAFSLVTGAGGARPGRRLRARESILAGSERASGGTT